MVVFVNIRIRSCKECDYFLRCMIEHIKVKRTCEHNRGEMNIDRGLIKELLESVSLAILHVWDMHFFNICCKLVQHIEAQFKEGMTWENHGEWHTIIRYL